MRRTRNAVLAAGFTYGQLGLAMLSGFVLIPFIVRALGARTYGVWLATGELVGYAGMLDLGVMAMLPWLVAQADGRRDIRELRSILARGFLVAAAAGTSVALLAILTWRFMPPVLGLAESDFVLLSGPLVIVVAVIAMTYPLRVFNAALVGLQDVVFTGSLAILQTIAGVGLTVWLLAEGFGLYAVAIGVAFPPAVTGLASLVRLRTLKRDVVRGWRFPELAGLRWIVVEGAGAWVAGLGWTMAAATSGIVIAFLGHPEAVVVYVCTAKLGQLLFQAARVIPDSGLVGLAQIDGEGVKDRVRDAVGTILRLHLLLAGAAATTVVLWNPIFVRLWVGREFFGGLTLNFAVTGALLFVSLTHGLVCCAAVLGHRRAIGAVTLGYGFLTIALSVKLGGALGLPGIAMAPVVSGLVTTLPAGVLLLRRAAALPWRRLGRDVATPWVIRLAPFLVLVAVVRVLIERLMTDGIFTLAVSLVSVMAYVWWMRPLYHLLPLHPALRGWLGRWKLAAPVVHAPVGEVKPWV